MQKSKGISMISLIVTIICIILLSSMAIGTGINYLRESKDREQSTFVSVLSGAVLKRQGETNVDSVLYPYLGYYIKNASVFETIFAPKLKDSSVTFESGTWYVVDTASASSLGVKQSEDYINTIDEGYAGEIKVALVNYATGDVYIIGVTSAEIGDLDISKDNNVTGHTHRYIVTEPTCTEPVKCADCGFILKEALGHLYDDALSKPEPADEKSHYTKVCIREGCNMKGGYELHTFRYEHSKENGAWYHTMGCPVCGYGIDDDNAQTEECTLRYTLSTDDAKRATHHTITCRVCKYSEDESHEVMYRNITESQHEIYCANTNCNYVIAKEFHKDSDGDDICDDCFGNIVSYTYPQLANVEMINKDAQTEEDKHYIKYGETIQLTFKSDKAVTNLDITLAGQSNDSLNITSSVDRKTWTIELLLEKGFNIPNGNINFKIMCESEVGIPLVVPVTQTSSGKYLIFDGDAPQIEYIDKNEVVKEN